MWNSTSLLIQLTTKTSNKYVNLYVILHSWTNIYLTLGLKLPSSSRTFVQTPTNADWLLVNWYPSWTLKCKFIFKYLCSYGDVCTRSLCTETYTEITWLHGCHVTFTALSVMGWNPTWGNIFCDSQIVVLTLSALFIPFMYVCKVFKVNKSK